MSSEPEPEREIAPSDETDPMAFVDKALENNWDPDTSNYDNINGFKSGLRGNAGKILELPAPDERWFATDLNETARGFFYKAAVSGFVVKEGQERPDANDEGSSPVSIWTVPEHVYDWALAEMDRRDTFPCGHPGFRNKGTDASGEQRYTCMDDGCQRDFGKAVANEVFR